jgi:choice-of-anchor C domain-containing protein
MQPLVEWRHFPGAFGVHFWIGVFGEGSIYANVADIDGNEHRVRSDTGLVVSNDFQHLGMSYNKASGLVRLYLNGRKVTEEAVGSFTPQTTSDLLVGYRGGTEYFTGVIDELSIYRRALSDAEFAGIWAAGSRGKCGTNAPPPPPGENLVFNGSFELGIDPGELRQIDAPNSTAITGWTVESGNIDYYGSAWVAGDGNRSLDMSGTTAGTISQLVSGFTVGQTYRLSFLMAGNPGLIPPLPAVKRLRATIGSSSAVQEYSFDATGHSAGDLGWILRTLNFTASSSTMTLRFVSLTDGLGGAALDKVSITLLTNAPPPPSTNCVPPPTGLVAWWPFEGTGQDLRGNNLAVFSGNPGFTAGRVGTALHFDGANDFARAAGSASLHVGAGHGLTVEGWIHPSDLSQLRPIVEWNDGTGSIGAHFWVSVDTLAFGDGRGNLFANLVDTAGVSHQVWSAANVVQADVWQHVVLTYDKTSGQAMLFRNGAMVAQTNLGSFTPQTSFPFLLRLAAVRAIQRHSLRRRSGRGEPYNRALPPVEILALYQADGAGKCPTNAPPTPPLRAFDLSRDYSSRPIRMVPGVTAI